jgi:hypothetical protein
MEVVKQLQEQIQKAILSISIVSTASVINVRR